MRSFFLLPLLLIPAAITLASLTVMLLWNLALVPVLHIGAVTFIHAVGILLLARLLFGGRGRHMGRWHRFHGRKRVFGQWHRLTPDEREHFRNRRYYKGGHCHHSF
ncbi:MAG: hypothetical protein EBZ77_10685 [Chitinophagia bacterium]|nr:hypothetical protein [Chitinophagia bacterium]